MSRHFIGAFVCADAGDPDALVDAADPSRSNWLRYLNHATTPAANCQMTDGAVVTTARLRVQPFVSQCYRYAAGTGDEGKAWYLLDEFGSRIRRHGAPVHDDGENCARIAPEPEPQPCEDASASSSNTCLARMAVYLDPEHGAFSVLWMETAGQAGDEVLLLDAN